MKEKNEFINRIKIYSIDDLKREYKRKTGGHWFDPSTMRFFKSRLSDELFYSHTENKIYFISSEQDLEGPREYSVRVYDVESGAIDTVGEFQQYSTLARAKSACRNILKERGNK